MAKVKKNTGKGTKEISKKQMKKTKGGSFRINTRSATPNTGKASGLAKGTRNFGGGDVGF